MSSLLLTAATLLFKPASALEWAWPPWNVTPIPGLRLEATGLIALADLKTLLVFTAYHAGGSIFHSMWVLPGLQAQQNVASAISQGVDKPHAVSMKTGHITNVENPATIFYLHRIATMGKLVHVDVLPEHLHPSRQRGKGRRRWWRELIHSFANGLAVGPMFTVIAALLLLISRDWFGLIVLGLLYSVRLSNTIMIKRRVMEAWMGALNERVIRRPEEEDDIVVFITLSRWVRMRGAAVDINAVTVGKWLRDMEPGENLMDALNKLAVFVAAALTTNVTQLGSIIIAFLLMLSAGAMGVVNTRRREELGMAGRKLLIREPPKAYESRKDLLEDLISETGTDDWAVELGFIRKDSTNGSIV